MRAGVVVCARVEEEDEPHPRSSKIGFGDPDAKTCHHSNQPKAASTIVRSGSSRTLSPIPASSLSSCRNGFDALQHSSSKLHLE